MQMQRAQNRAGKGWILLWRRFNFPIFLLFIYAQTPLLFRKTGAEPYSQRYRYCSLLSSQHIVANSRHIFFATATMSEKIMSTNNNLLTLWHFRVVAKILAGAQPCFLDIFVSDVNWLQKQVGLSFLRFDIITLNVSPAAPPGRCEGAAIPQLFPAQPPYI